MKVLLTGIAGTGKSTITKALSERGFNSMDLHDVPGLFYWQKRDTKERIGYTQVHSKEWFDTVDRLCDIDKLKEIISNNDDIIVAGTAGGNQTEYFPLFDKVILLQCSADTIIHRMKTRNNKSGFGKTKAEQEDNIEWQSEFDPLVLSYGAIPVNTEGDLNDVLDKIIHIIKAS